MKNARITKAVSSVTRQGDEIMALGRTPTRLNTVTAEVLARLLNHERLTSLDAVDEASTTRLSAVTFYLAEKYGWPIEKNEKAAGCRDGRVAWVAEYFLPPEVVAQAMGDGVGEWCSKVRGARLARRTKAAEAQRIAERFNAALKRRRPPGQWGLFDGGAA